MDCGSLTDPANGTVSLITTTFGSTATYTCNGVNYLLVGEAMRTCQATGSWSSDTPTCGKLHTTSMHEFVPCPRLILCSDNIIFIALMKVSKQCMYVEYEQ